MKSMTLRLEDELACDLDTVAAVDGLPVSEVVRAAILAHIDSRTRDPQFQESLRTRIALDQELLNRGSAREGGAARGSDS